jgi:HEAT repeat protein
MGRGKEHWDRVAWLEGMGRQGEKWRIPELIAVLDDEKECWHTRTTAMRSLVQLEAREAGPAILKLLARDDDPDTREVAIDALGALRCEQATRLLERIQAADDETRVLREKAGLALERIRHPIYR